MTKLEKSALNARRTVRNDGIGELRASILSHGLMQNLVATTVGGEPWSQAFSGYKKDERIKKPKQ